MEHYRKVNTRVEDSPELKDLPLVTIKQGGNVKGKFMHSSQASNIQTALIPGINYHTNSYQVINYHNNSYQVINYHNNSYQDTYRPALRF